MSNGKIWSDGTKEDRTKAFDDEAGAASEDDEVAPGLGNGGNPFPDGLDDDRGNSGVGMDPYLAQLVYLENFIRQVQMKWMINSYNWLTLKLFFQ